jgi:hypothetical protein
MLVDIFCKQLEENRTETSGNKDQTLYTCPYGKWRSQHPFPFYSQLSNESGGYKNMKFVSSNMDGGSRYAVAHMSKI